MRKAALEREGFTVIERREPSLLVDRCVLITGEVDRTTEFEHGMPPAHQAWTGSAWRPDPLVIDDQALVEPTIGPTVRALTDLDPALLVPGHCTGWRAQHALAAALPKSWVAGSSGSSFRLTAA